MKIYKLKYQSKVMGIRISDIPNCRYSLDLEYELAKKVLSYIDKKDIVNGGTLSLKEKDNMYVTENEVDVINISSVKECLRYINSDSAVIKKEGMISGCYISLYAERKLDRLLPEILGNTGLKYKIIGLKYKRAGERFVQLFFKEEDKPNPYDKKFGIYLGVDDTDASVIDITAVVASITTETIRYITGGSEKHRNVHPIATYKKVVSIDNSKLIDVGKVDGGKYVRRSMWGKKVNSEKFLKDYPNFITVGYSMYGSWYALPAEYVEELFNPIFKEIVEFFKSNIPKIVQELSDDNAVNHLNDFSPLSKDKLIELISIYPKCYYCKYEGTPTYSELSNTEEHLQEMSVPYNTFIGFRRYLVWNNELYLWFGLDEKGSWST